MALSIIDKINSLSNFYYRIKTIIFYRIIFKSIGSKTTIRRPLLITNPQFISIGSNVLIRDGIRLEVVLWHRNERCPSLQIGDNTNIEQNVHIVCRNKVVIGSNVSVTGNCAIVDVTHPYTDLRSPNKIGNRFLCDDSFVEIGDGSFIGFGSVILPNVRIGKNVVVGANSVVLNDIPDCSVAVGTPAKIIKKFNEKNGDWEKMGIKHVKS